jgi:hypothetical protein
MRRLDWSFGMATVSETIPESLRPEVDAAIAWFNAAQADAFEVTGIVDADLTIASSEPREMRLVLCGGGTCQQRSFQVSSAAAGFDVAFSEPAAATAGAPEALQAELDPPPGARRDWLDSVLGKHRFVVLVFYRGFW